MISFQKRKDFSSDFITQKNYHDSYFQMGMFLFSDSTTRKNTTVEEFHCCSGFCIDLLAKEQNDTIFYQKPTRGLKCITLEKHI